MVDNESGLFIDPRLMEPEPFGQEKTLRDLFVQEYMKDFDALQACLRVGFQAAFALEFSRKFMGESYVQRKIAALQRTPPKDEEEQAKEDKALIMSVLRQAAQNGPYATRVQAASRLAAIYKLDSDDAPEDTEASLIEAFREFASRAPA